MSPFEVARTKRDERDETTLDLLGEEVPCLSISATWGETTLSVCQLAPPRAYYVGESREMLDTLVPGFRRTALLDVSKDGAVALALIPGAKGSITLPGAEREPFAIEPRAAKRLVDFPPGAEAIVVLGGITFHIEHESAPLVKRSAALGPRSLRASIAASIAIHTLTLAVASQWFVSVADAEHAVPVQPIEASSMLTALVTLAEQEHDAHLSESIIESDLNEDDSIKMRCGEVHGGGMGEVSAPEGDGRHGVEGPADNPDPHLARFEHGPSVTFFYIFGIPVPSRYVRGPVAPWGRDDELGRDERSNRGHLFGARVERAFGVPGIGAGPSRLCATCGSLGGGREHRSTLSASATRTEAATQITSAAAPLVMCEAPLIEAPLTRVVLK